MIKTGDIISVNKNLPSAYKKMMTNNFIKILSIIKYKHFMKITKMKNNKNYRLLSNKKIILKPFFNNMKLILTNSLSLKLLRPDMYGSAN